MKLFLFWLVAAPLLAHPLLAGSLISPGGDLNSGGIICPLLGQHPRVSLKRQAFLFRPDVAQVQAEYVLRNEGDARRLTFCVPEYGGGSRTLGLKNLRVWVDGRRVHPTCKPFYNTPHTDANYSTLYALWEAQCWLGRRRTRRIHVSFTSWMSGHEAVLYPLYFPKEQWRGSVQRTDLKIVSKWSIVRLFPKGVDGPCDELQTRKRDHGLTYRWRNWKPSGFLWVVEDD